MQLLKVLARVLEYPTDELQQSKDALVAAVLEDSRLPRQNKEQLLQQLCLICPAASSDSHQKRSARFLARPEY